MIWTAPDGTRYKLVPHGSKDGYNEIWSRDDAAPAPAPAPLLTLVPPVETEDLDTALHAIILNHRCSGRYSRMTVSVEGGNIVVREAGA